MINEVKIDNNLFNEKKMQELINKYGNDLVVSAPKKNPVETWIEKLNAGELESEKDNYFNFRDIILIDLLGYDRDDIIYEKNIGNKGHPVEFTILNEDKEFAIIELKGTTYENLEKRKNGKQSPVEQATNYASIKEATKWAIVSNYDEFRLFNPSYNEKYISFKFRQLEDENVLKKFLLIFSKISLIDLDIPRTLLKETRVIERDLEDEFYQLYSETRLMLIKELEFSSEDINRLEAIRLAQLILNRFIFLCFAEDIFLIPSETIADVLITPIRHRNLFEFTMWDRLNELFRFVDKGNEERKIHAFNGGLFKENLRHLEIRDKIDDVSFFDDCRTTWTFNDKYEDIEKLLDVYKDTLNPIYKNLLTISSFDFGSELSVNILGHIFENSISDIEELKDDNSEQRKKDGVFYTPEYITEYICRNTIIPYLSLSGNAKTVHELIGEYENSNKLEDLDYKLENIKIIDPACGSGSMLNKAVDILLEIHKALYDSKYEGDSSLDRFYDTLEHRRKIILNNIYGADLNEESVEITKLSLFLKLATTSGLKQGFRLPNLDKNIKCGNSIIDDNNVVGDSSFKWEVEFKEIFDEGGFDIVIGNPPYITPSLGKKQKTLTDEEIKYLEEKYESYEYKGNTYVIFIEKGIDILKEYGILSYITPNTLLTNYNYKNIRNILLDRTSIKELVKIEDKVFRDAETGGNLISIFIKTKDNENNKINCVSFNDSENIFNLNKFNKVNQGDLKHIPDCKFLLNQEETDFLIKLKNSNDSLIEHAVFYNGIKTGNNDKFLSKSKLNDKYVKVLRGKDIFKYYLRFDDEYVLFDKEQLWSNHDETKYQVSEKIIVRQTSDRIIGAYDNSQHYTLDSTHLIIPNEDINCKYLLGLLNSKLINYYYQKLIPEIGKTFAEVKIVNLKHLPIRINDKYENAIISKVDELMMLNKKLTDLQINFRNWLNLEYQCGEISNRNKLFKFWELDEKQFFIYLKKKIGKINVKTYSLIKNEWEEVSSEINSLNNEIKKIEQELDELIYELYNLSTEEIEIVKNNGMD